MTAVRRMLISFDAFDWHIVPPQSQYRNFHSFAFHIPLTWPDSFFCVCLYVFKTFINAFKRTHSLRFVYFSPFLHRSVGRSLRVLINCYQLFFAIPFCFSHFFFNFSFAYVFFIFTYFFLFFVLFSCCSTFRLPYWSLIHFMCVCVSVWMCMWCCRCCCSIHEASSNSDFFNLFVWKFSTFNQHMC